MSSRRVIYTLDASNGATWAKGEFTGCDTAGLVAILIVELFAALLMLVPMCFTASRADLFGDDGSQRSSPALDAAYRSDTRLL